MIHYRNLASWLDLRFDCDLTEMSAVCEDMIVDGILGRDEFFVGNRK